MRARSGNVPVGRVPSPGKSRARGFALVITIVLLALLVLCIYALSALGRVGVGMTTTAVYHTQARQHALLGLRVALGRLQAMAGDDAAITGMAGLTGVAAGSGHPARHWCGVWESNGQWRGWLASGVDGALIPSLTGADSVAVLASGALGADGTDKEHVRVPLLPVILHDEQGGAATTGHYAWWVGDEGVKLSALIPDDQAPVFGEKHAIDELIPALSPTATELSGVEAYAQLMYVPVTPLTPGQLQSNLHALGRSHRSVVGTELRAGRINLNSTSARYWRGVAATYNRLRPAAPLAISVSTFADRMRDNFPGTVAAGKEAGGPFLTVEDFLAGPLLETVLQDSDVDPADFADAMRPWLVVRSDTFRIRIYGDAVNGADPNQVEAEAWCEAIVQRVPDTLSGFGRRFVLGSFRWLGPDDI